MASSAAGRLSGTWAAGRRLLTRGANRRASLETYDPHKNTTEVRQGSPRRMNMRVLVISLIGIVVLFAIIYLIFTMSQPNPT